MDAKRSNSGKHIPFAIVVLDKIGKGGTDHSSAAGNDLLSFGNSRHLLDFAWMDRELNEVWGIIEQQYPEGSRLGHG